MASSSIDVNKIAEKKLERRHCRERQCVCERRKTIKEEKRNRGRERGLEDGGRVIMTKETSSREREEESTERKDKWRG